MRPGVNIAVRTTPPARGPSVDTGHAFVAGIAARGRTDAPVRIRNLSEFELHYGARDAGGYLWDAADWLFREGLTELHVQRVVGPAATKDTVALPGAAAALSISVDSIGEGDTALTAAVEVTGSTFVLVIADAGVEVERSYALASPAAAVAWALASSNYVRVRATGAVNPVAAAATALTGGNEDRAAITDTHRTTALAKFAKALGPGQVLYPGATTIAMHTALTDHARLNNRFAPLDPADTASDTTLKAAADAVRAAYVDQTYPSYAALFAPWVIVPGVVAGTTRTLPPSILAAGLLARSDGRGLGPNEAAAGDNGVSAYAIALSQVAWTDTVREAMNAKGVNVIRDVYGAFKLYGARTLAHPDTNPEWLAIGAARTRMAISAEADAAGERMMFRQIDGRGLTIAEFNGMLTGICLRYWNLGALYGASAPEAFIVDTGASVNTPATLALDQLRAVISLRVSPYAEMVTIEIVKQPITVPLAA